jgi:hypothetical protein
MRRLLIGCVVLATVLVENRPHAEKAPAAPPPDELPATWLEGNIGGRAVRMFIEDGGWPKDDGVWGAYYYTSDWLPLMLDGTRLADGTVRLYEGEPGPSVEGRPRFDIKLGTTVTGTWTAGDTAPKVPVRLHRTKQPLRYEDAIKSPRRFADPGWPLQLTYPAGWRLDVGGTDLTLRSPDPQDMMFDTMLQCERGRGLPPAPQAGEAATEFKGFFYRAADGWRIEGNPEHECDDAESCPIARTRRVGSVSLMSGETSYRSHNAWGYSGIASAREHLVIDGEEWAHCSDGLLDSDSRLQPRAPGRRLE